MNYIATRQGITAVIGGKEFTITSDNPTYGQVLDALKNHAPDWEIEDLFVLTNAVKRYAKGNITIEDGSVLYFKGEEIHGTVVDRILKFMGEGLPVEPLVAFLERLLANPSKRSIEELYTFLEHKNLPLTPDGHFLAYKGVSQDYKDVHSGKFDNRPGQSHSMPRNKVCDDYRQGCSYGFHVGSLEYATHWGQRTVIVKVDPADVVSVPSDCDCQKLRTSRYSVVSDYNGPLPESLASKDNFIDDDDDDFDLDW